MAKWLPANINQSLPQLCSYHITNNSGTMFRRKQRILKLGDYTATPEQSATATINCSALPESLSSSENIPQSPTKCIHIVEPLLVTDYRAVPPVPTVADTRNLSRTVSTRLQFHCSHSPSALLPDNQENIA